MPHLACLHLPFLHQTLSNTPPGACNPSASCRGGDTSTALLCFGGSELTIPPSTLSGEAGSRRSLPSPPPRRRGQPWPASGRSRGLARPFPGLSKPFPVLAVPFRAISAGCAAAPPARWAPSSSAVPAPTGTGGAGSGSPSGCGRSATDPPTTRARSPAAPSCCPASISSR